MLNTSCRVWKPARIEFSKEDFASEQKESEIVVFFGGGGGGGPARRGQTGKKGNGGFSGAFAVGNPALSPFSGAFTILSTNHLYICVSKVKYCLLQIFTVSHCALLIAANLVRPGSMCVSCRLRAPNLLLLGEGLQELHRSFVLPTAQTSKQLWENNSDPKSACRKLLLASVWEGLQTSSSQYQLHPCEKQWQACRNEAGPTYTIFPCTIARSMGFVVFFPRLFCHSSQHTLLDTACTIDKLVRGAGQSRQPTYIAPQASSINLRRTSQKGA